MSSTPCELRRSTNCCFDCRWCGASRQEYDDKVCDKCGVKYDLRLFFESFGNGLRIFGDFSINKDWNFEISKQIFYKIFKTEPMNGEFVPALLGWILKTNTESVRKTLISLGIDGWYSNSEIAARVQQESDIGVDI